MQAARELTELRKRLRELLVRFSRVLRARACGLFVDERGRRCAARSRASRAAAAHHHGDCARGAAARHAPAATPEPARPQAARAPRRWRAPCATSSVNPAIRCSSPRRERCVVSRSRPPPHPTTSPSSTIGAPTPERIPSSCSRWAAGPSAPHSHPLAPAGHCGRSSARASPRRARCEHPRECSEPPARSTHRSRPRCRHGGSGPCSPSERSSRPPTSAVTVEKTRRGIDGHSRRASRPAAAPPARRAGPAPPGRRRRPLRGRASHTAAVA